MSKVKFGSVEVDAERYEYWQKSVIYEQKRFSDQDSAVARQSQAAAAKRQSELVARVEEGPAAVEKFIVSGVLAITDIEAARASVPALPNPLTAGEMTKLTRYAERRIADAVEGSITPALAAEPAVWALCHAVWMGRGVFGGDLPTVFLHGGKANAQEARVRNFLRRTGGLRPVRGNTSPLVDCPISAAWWRVALAREAVALAEDRLGFEAAHDLLRSGHVWENLVGMLLRQVTAVCSPRARSAILCALASRSDTGAPVERAHIQAVIRVLGATSYSHSLDSTPMGVLVAAAGAALVFQ